MIEINRTYKYRLYTHKRNRHLHDAINVAGLIWNHCIALQRRYYRLTSKYISRNRLQTHLSNLRNNRFLYWQKVGSQAVQEITERLDKGYKRFFKKEGGIPSFKKINKYKSFTLKQSGWKLLGKNHIQLLGRNYKFVKSREIQGVIKTVTVKRDTLGKLWLCFSVIEAFKVEKRVTSGETVGLDFGLKTFLTTDTGIKIQSPLFFKRGQRDIARLNQELSRKKRGSNNRNKAKQTLAKAHEKIANQRDNFQWQLAHDLCKHFDHIYIEDLNMKGMQAMWGRKISDLGFADFVHKLKWVAFKTGATVTKIDRWYPSSKTCSNCGKVQEAIPLHQRTFECADCGLCLDRDHNAAKNIKQVGSSTCS